MAEFLETLNAILGEERLKEITSQPSTAANDDLQTNLMNSKEISCECKTIILKPSQAKLIVPSESMLEIEKDLMFLQRNDGTFKYLTRGCYWMVDDMYKFEQMGYTKEVDISSHRVASSQNQVSENTAQTGDDQSQVSPQASNDNPTTPNPIVKNGLRYLACAECNLCPLGWYDPKTKESYLYVW